MYLHTQNVQAALVPGDCQREYTAFITVIEEHEMDKFAEIDNEGLQSLRTEKMDAFMALRALDGPTVAQVGEATALAAEIDEIDTEIKERATAASEAADAFEALKTRSFGEVVEGEVVEVVDEDAEDDEDEDEKDDEVEDEADAEKAEVAASLKVPATKAQRIAAKTKRPAKPERDSGRVTITAAADVGGSFATGQDLGDIAQTTEALLTKMKGFAVPNGDGQSEDLRMYPVASFALEFPQDLIIDRHSDDMEVLTHASDETRLPGNSLTAAAGWCAPSETLYDLCAGETTDGMVSVPEVQVNRGGIKYTSGVDFSTIYTNTGFTQTEAQAIAGTTKPCYEVPCPTFTETRLDAVGLCIKVPILLNSAYPEVTNRVTSGSMIAHAHRVNASVIGRMVTAAGAARVFTGNGGVYADTVEALEIVIIQSRQKYKLSMNASLEVILPYFAKGAMRADLSRRAGRPTGAVTDAEIASHFSGIGANVQWVYDWQEMSSSALVWPTTYQALVYPAGTFVKGVSNVINLSAVYDAASLAVNTYTGLFMEQGLLVAKLCYNADLLTLPVCAAGRTGASNLTCA